MMTEESCRIKETLSDVKLRIRRASPLDLPVLRQLEEACFGDPWSERLLLETLESEYDSLLILETVLPLGYANSRVLGDEAELMRICIAPELRGRGLSGPLLDAALEEMRCCGAVSATLEVRAGNVPARKLYESRGFLPEGLRKRYYQNPTEDAVIYWKRGFAG